MPGWSHPTRIRSGMVNVLEGERFKVPRCEDKEQMMEEALGAVVGGSPTVVGLSGIAIAPFVANIQQSLKL